MTFMALTSAASLGIPVANLPAPGGAWNSGGVESGSTQSGIMLINANGAGGGTISLDFARFAFIAEMSEQLMPAHGYVRGGNRVGASRGEALSRILAEEFFPEPAYLPQCISVAPWVNDWLNSSPRLDYINQNPAATPATPSWVAISTSLDTAAECCSSTTCGISLAIRSRLSWAQAV